MVGYGLKDHSKNGMHLYCELATIGFRYHLPINASLSYRKSNNTSQETQIQPHCPFIEGLIDGCRLTIGYEKRLLIDLWRRT